MHVVLLRQCRPRGASGRTGGFRRAPPCPPPPAVHPRQTGPAGSSVRVMCGFVITVIPSNSIFCVSSHIFLRCTQSSLTLVLLTLSQLAFLRGKKRMQTQSVHYLGGCLLSCVTWAPGSVSLPSLMGEGRAMVFFINLKDPKLRKSGFTFSAGQLPSPPYPLVCRGSMVPLAKCPRSGTPRPSHVPAV